MVAEVGFEPHDLRVMSPTSYQAALLRDIEFFPLGAGDRGRTGTILSYHGILSPGRLPVPPHRRSSMAFSRTCILYHLFLYLSTPFSKIFEILFLIRKKSSSPVHSLSCMLIPIYDMHPKNNLF